MSGHKIGSYSIPDNTVYESLKGLDITDNNQLKKMDKNKDGVINKEEITNFIDENDLAEFVEEGNESQVAADETDKTETKMGEYTIQGTKVAELLSSANINDSEYLQILDKNGDKVITEAEIMELDLQEESQKNEARTQAEALQDKLDKLDEDYEENLEMYQKQIEFYEKEKALFQRAMMSAKISGEQNSNSQGGESSSEDMFTYYGLVEDYSEKINKAIDGIISLKQNYDSQRENLEDQIRSAEESAS